MTRPTVDGQLDALRQEIRTLRRGLLIVAVLLGVCVGWLTFRVDALAGTETPAATPTVSPATSTPDSDVLRGLRAERLRDRPVSRSSPRPVSMDIRKPNITATGKRHGDLAAAFWRIAGCESGHDPAAVNPAGPYLGRLQWLRSTWTANGGRGDPRDATWAEELAVAVRLHSRSSFTPWPACSRKLGYL